MAVWVKFKAAYPLVEVAARCRAKGLYLSDGHAYQAPGRNLNACRMGFASMHEEEIMQTCQLLKAVLQEMESRSLPRP